MIVIERPRQRRLFLVAITLVVLNTSAESIGGNEEGKIIRLRRVIGGSEVTDGQWSFLVNLHGHIPSSRWWVFVTSYVDYSCAGSLIGKRWVLTAAHCFKTLHPLQGLDAPRKWRVKAGDVSRKPGSLLDVLESALGADVSGDSGRWWYVRISKIIVHPDYEPADTFSRKNDLALVKLAKELPTAPENPNIDLVALPTNRNTSWPPPGTSCSLMGWGCTEKDGPNQERARMLNVPVVEKRDCAGDYGDLEDDRICAGYFYGGKGICKGDSGGPLVCLDGTTWKLAGVISYTSSNVPADRPGVFTRVAKFLSWITNVTAII